MDKLDTFRLGKDINSVIADGAVKGDIDQIKNVARLKEMIANYKYVVSGQSDMLNTLLKSKGKKEEAVGSFDYDRLLDNERIKKATEFLQQQKEYLKRSQNRIVRYDCNMCLGGCEEDNN